MKTVWNFNGGYILVIGDVDVDALKKSIDMFEKYSGLQEPTLYYPTEVVYSDQGDILDWND